MFDKDFYPTPKPVIQRMLSGVNFRDKRILEPSAGKGDILDYIFGIEDSRCRRGSVALKAKLFAIELHPELSDILRGKKYTVLAHDFLAYAPEQRFDLIVMNPPFSDGAKHLIKALQIADGAEVICLLNKETLANAYTKERELLVQMIQALGGNVVDFGPCFMEAERRTAVEVVCVKIPARERKKFFEFEANAYGEKNHTLEDVASGAVVSSDLFTTLVQRYDAIKRAGAKMYQALAELNFYAEGLGVNPHDAFTTSFKGADGTLDTAYENFIKIIRQQAWDSLYDQTKISGLVTTKVRQDLQEAQNGQRVMAFTLDNLNALFSALMMNLTHIRSDCILSAFDILTSYHPDNKVHVEGWRHNDAWTVSYKIIVPHGVSYYNCKDAHPSISHDQYSKFQDIEKALCFVAGKEYESIKNTTIWEVCNRIKGTWSFNPDQIKWGEWIDTEFFLVKFFKKGTIHLKFKDFSLCDRFNIEAAKGKNWLPADYGKSTVKHRKQKSKAA